MGQDLTLKIVNLKEKKRGRKQTDRNSDALRRPSRYFGDFPSTEKTLLAATFKVDSDSKS